MELRRQVVGPEMVVVFRVADEVAEIKQREVVHQLVEGIALLLADDLVFADEIALLQFLQGADKNGIVVESRVF